MGILCMGRDAVGGRGFEGSHGRGVTEKILFTDTYRT